MKPTCWVTALSCALLALPVPARGEEIPAEYRDLVKKGLAWLVRLRAARVPLLRKLIYEAWRCQAPRELQQEGPRLAAGPRRSRGRDRAK